MEKHTNRDAVIVRTSVVGIIANIFLAGFKANDSHYRHPQTTQSMAIQMALSISMDKTLLYSEMVLRFHRSVVTFLFEHPAIFLPVFFEELPIDGVTGEKVRHGKPLLSWL